MKTLLVTISMCSVLWLAGCATEKSDSSVARTLNSYQVGTTTYADLKHDAQLRENTRVMNAVVQPASNPPQVVPRTVRTYDVPRGSHWRIFDTKDQSKTDNGTLVSRSRQLTVGTPAGPLYILTFDLNGVLVDKRPVS